MTDAGVVSRLSPWSVDDTVARLSAVARARELQVFAIIDHGEEAERSGLRLRETKLVLLGDAEMWTAAIEAVPYAALDVPLRVVVWSDHEQTTLSYVAPTELALRYGLGEEFVGGVSLLKEIVEVVINR
jgi:uncharacterized protein (DUF302 family)